MPLFRSLRRLWSPAWGVLLWVACGLPAARAQPPAPGPIGPRMLPENPLPGPGPNRLEQATSATYRLGLGDTVQVAITFRPTPPAAEQRILPRDVLAISYHFGLPDPREPYRIQPFDEVYLQFRYSPELSRLYTQQQDERVSVLSRPYVVTPEGTLVLPGINRLLRVADLTTSGVRERVRAAYTGFLQDPELTVSVTPAFRQEETLHEALGKGRTEPLAVIVPEDGRLALPLLPEIATRGRNVRELAAELTRRYRELGYPRLTVNVWFQTIADERHQQLRDLIATNKTLALSIGQTGHLSLPMIPDLPAVGRTCTQLAGELTARYRELGLERVEVAVWLCTPRSRVVRILGEVTWPGAYPIYGQADLWGVVALAGGFTPRADAARVRVIPRPGAAPQGPFSFEQFSASGDAAHDPLLAGDELIIVPAVR